MTARTIPALTLLGALSSPAAAHRYQPVKKPPPTQTVHLLELKERSGAGGRSYLVGSTPLATTVVGPRYSVTSAAHETLRQGGVVRQVQDKKTGITTAKIVEPKFRPRVLSSTWVTVDGKAYRQISFIRSDKRVGTAVIDPQTGFELRTGK